MGLFENISYPEKRQRLQLLSARIVQEGIKLDPNVKVAWVSALRSGQYEQTHGALQRVDYSPKGSAATHQVQPGHCCLGVLADVDGVPHAQEDPHGPMWFHFTDDYGNTFRQEGVLHDSYANKVSLTGAAMDFLMDANDGGATFADIADWIEEVL